MPIGKNAIKRVENNGYSKVKTSAPDMENSAELLPEAAEKEAAPAAAKKRTYTRRKTSAKVSETTAKKEKNGFERVEIGEELPYWLL